MKRCGRQPGITLNELLFVMAAIIVLTLMAAPAARKIGNSFETGYAVRHVIGAALANARAIAAREQKYAGVRFQQDLNGDQYMIFIVHDFDAIGLANGFRAVEGRKPIKLPNNLGVLDLRLVNRTVLANNHVQYVETPVTMDSQMADLRSFVAECSTFSIVFSPAGRLVLHEVRVRNRHGLTAGSTITSADDIFNKRDEVFDGKAMFMQDDYFQFDSPFRYGPEMSRNSFVIYDKRRLAAVPADRRWSDYLKDLDWVYVNPHTGELVNN